MIKGGRRILETSSRKTTQTMKKFIFINNAITVMDKLLSSKRVEGVLYVDENTGRLTFKAYNRKPKSLQRNRLICLLEHGWVKESAERIKVYESIPKVLGTMKVTGVLDREIRDAQNALIERELEML